MFSISSKPCSHLVVHYAQDLIYDCKNTYKINYHFKCESSGVVYLLSCKKCAKSYVGRTINSFRQRFHNHRRYGNGPGGKHLYAHFFTEGHDGLSELSGNIINKLDVNNPTYREGYWIYR